MCRFFRVDLSSSCIEGCATVRLRIVMTNKYDALKLQLDCNHVRAARLRGALGFRV